MQAGPLMKHLLTSNSRPCDQQQRVRPSSLRDHRQATIMLGPCCLCPMKDASAPDFVEAAMYLATAGPFAGQYVIGCAQDKCGYLGEWGKLLYRFIAAYQVNSVCGKNLRQAWCIYQGL